MSPRRTETALMVNPPSESRQECERAPARRILVVDDEEFARTAFRTYLTKAGFEIDEAENGETALERIYHFEPHVVLLDILMPGVTGNELVETIKEWKPDLEIIMVASVDCEEVKLECLTKGAFAVLVKPVNMRVLTSTIQQALEKRDVPQN